MPHHPAHPDPVINRFFSHIPKDLAESFSEEQLAAIKQVYGARTHKAHAVDIRLSIPVFWARYYLVLLVGTERRSHSRRKAERRHHPSLTLANMIFIVFLMIALLLSSVVMLYILKSAIGIDLVPSYSFGLWGAIKQQLPYLF